MGGWGGLQVGQGRRSRWRMAGGGAGGVRRCLPCNVRLDRHLAWKDPATGLVWMPMFALRPIAAGEFLRFKYDPTAGEGGAY